VLKSLASRSTPQGGYNGDNFAALDSSESVSSLQAVMSVAAANASIDFANRFMYFSLSV
jgi:hypothetical protein